MFIIKLNRLYFEVCKELKKAFLDKFFGQVEVKNLLTDKEKKIFTLDRLSKTEKTTFRFEAVLFPLYLIYRICLRTKKIRIHHA